MEIKSVKLNFILNAIRIFLGAFFILITTPYVTRVLGVENLGKVDYVTSIIQYFILFTALGVRQNTDSFIGLYVRMGTTIYGGLKSIFLLQFALTTPFSLLLSSPPLSFIIRKAPQYHAFLWLTY